MIWTVNSLKTMSEFSEIPDELLQLKLDGIEALVRSYTNNNFQNRNVRFKAPFIDNVICGSSPYLRVGDTIQITQSKVNDGLYVVKNVRDDTIRLDRYLFDGGGVITKVEYPNDVKKGVLYLLQWEITVKPKQGIQSETISRHSVTYYNQDASNQSNGYPVSLLGFLEPYRKARF